MGLPSFGLAENRNWPGLFTRSGKELPHDDLAACRQACSQRDADRPGAASTRIFRPAARLGRSQPIGQLRHQRTSGHAPQRHIYRSAHPRHHPGHLRLSPQPRHGRPALHGQGHARGFWAGSTHRAGSPGGQRRRDHHPAGRRLHADAGHLAGHPRLQPRPQGAPRGRHRHHAVAQSAGGRRLQIQPDQRRPRRHRRDRLGPGPRQRTAARRQCGGPPRAVRHGDQGRDHAAGRFHTPLRQRSAQRHRYGRDSRGRAQAWRGSARRRVACITGGRSTRFTV